MDFHGFKEAVIAAAREAGIADFELYYQAEESTSVSAYLHDTDQFTASMEGGVCLRCIVDGKMGYASTEDLNPAGAAQLLARAADNARTLESRDPVFLGEGGQSYVPLPESSDPLPTTEELISGVLETQELLYSAHSAVIDGCSTQGISARSTIAIYNSRGLNLERSGNLSGLVVAAVVSDGAEMANDYQIKLGQLKTLDKAALTKKAAEEAVRKLGGDVAPTGQYPVVFAPEAMADLLQVYSSVFSSEAAQKGLSKLAQKEGSVIASPLVTLVDDPFHPENPCKRNFDAEGSPTARKNVIEKGVLNTLLYNMKTAAIAGKTTTGNASKSGYASDVAVQPFTLYLQNGDRTEEALLAQAGTGVYITSLSGLHAGANPISGDFSLQSAGFLIENGRKTVPVKSFTVAGNFYTLLENITALADNCELPMAMSSTAFGAPSVLVEGLSIAGK